MNSSTYVYLCYCNDPNKQKLFVCRAFGTYEYANKYMNNFTAGIGRTGPNSVFKTVSICKHIPYCFVPWIIKWKLSAHNYGIKIF
jgi:hypothetical protein